MKMDAKSSSSLWVVLTRITTVLFATIYSILSKVFLGDKATALMGSTAIVNSYNKYFDIALDPVVSGVTRRTPILLNLNETKELERLNNSSFTISMIIAAFACILNLTLGFISDNDFTRMLFFTMAFASVFKVLNRFITVQKAAEMKLVNISKVLTFSMVFTYIISILIIFAYGVLGFYLATFLITSLSGLIVFILYGFKSYSLQIDIPVLKKSLIGSLPMLVFGISEIYIFTFDKFILSNNISIEELGVYNFAFQSSQLLYGLVVSYMGSMYSFYVLDIEEAKSKRHIYDLFDREIYRILMVLTVFLVGLLSFFEIVTSVLLIDFKEGLSMLYLFSMISIFFSSHYLFYIYLLVRNRNTTLLKISFSSIAVSTFVYYVASTMVLTPENFTGVVVLAYFIRSFLLVTWCSIEFGIAGLVSLFVSRVFLFAFIPGIYFILSESFSLGTHLVGILFKLFMSVAVLVLISVLLGKRKQGIQLLLRVIGKESMLR
jgi:O-antigen/teichoic acid export membrane protein